MTIYALSSGSSISGIGVIRVSGRETKNVIAKLTNGTFPKPREATLKKINEINLFGAQSTYCVDIFLMY